MTEDNDQIENQGTTLDLTGLKHTNVDSMMSEAIDKVNQVGNLDELEAIDKTEAPKTEPTEEPKTKEIQIKKTKEETKIEKPEEIEIPKVELKQKERTGEKAKEEKTKIEIKKNKPIKEEDIVLELSGGRPEKRTEHKLPKINIHLSKKTMIVIGGITLLALIIVASVLFVVPAIKKQFESKKNTKQETPIETVTPKPTPKTTINNLLQKDTLNENLKEHQNISSILKVIEKDISTYPISDINSDLDTLIIESSTSVN